MPSASFYNVASWSWCAHAVFRRARQHLEKYPWLTQLLSRRRFKVVAVATAPLSANARFITLKILTFQNFPSPKRSLLRLRVLPDSGGISAEQEARTDFGLAHAPVPVEHAGARSAGVVKMPSTDPTTKDQLTRALGDAVIRIWSNLPQDVQNHLFQEAVSSQGESIRSQLAIFLHDKHSRTSDPLGNPREMPEPDSHGG
jgi:hypothetical protein